MGSQRKAGERHEPCRDGLPVKERTLYMGTLTFPAMTVRGHSTSVFSERPLAQGFNLAGGIVSVSPRSHSSRIRLRCRPYVFFPSSVENEFCPSLTR